MGAASELVTVNRNGKQPRQLRISKRVRRAIELMVYDGLARDAAAERAGLSSHGLYCALRKPHVLAFRRQCVADLQGSEASRSIARMAHLADNSTSDHVKADANKWLAGLDGYVPVQRQEHHIAGRVEVVTPGYVIDLSPLRDVTPAVEAVEGAGGGAPDTQSGAG